MEKIYLSQLEPELAAQLLVGMERFDPAGTLDAEKIRTITDRGACFAATSEDNKSQAVYVLSIDNGVARVCFAKGAGPADWCSILGPVIDAQVKGVRRVVFQTLRPGLKRRAERQGYTVRGWIMGKELQ